jgi:4'-phosphopantetheinyl transferase
MPETSSPPQPDRALALGDDEVHVWYGRPHEWADALAGLAALLSADELARAGRFRFAADRARYCLSRAGLRSLLGAYCGAPASAIQFTYSAYGKPALAGTGRDLQFNISHARGVTAYAITRGRPVGIDVERVRPGGDWEHIVRTQFAAAEAEAYRALPAQDRLTGFFTAWTRKEAFIKALGTGLSRPLSGFAVTLAPGEPARLLSIDGNPAAAALWTIRDVPVGPPYVAALAVAGTGLRVRARTWAPSPH